MLCHANSVMSMLCHANSVLNMVTLTKINHGFIIVTIVKLHVFVVKH